MEMKIIRILLAKNDQELMVPVDEMALRVELQWVTLALSIFEHRTRQTGFKASSLLNLILNKE